MSKVLLTSDFHIQAGIYTDIGMDYIDYLQDFCKKEKITDVIIAGDIFEKSAKIQNEAFIPLFFKFKELRERGKLDNEYITCLFPHACPDGSSDKLMIELMGDSRCSPEKRISRRDL